MALHARALTMLSGLAVKEAYIVLLSVGEAVPIDLQSVKEDKKALP